MSERTTGTPIPQQTPSPVTSRRAAAVEPEPSAMTGALAFGGLMMAMLGMFHIVQGLVAVFREDYFLAASTELMVDVDYAVWGWVHIVGGILVAAAGAALVVGRTWARATCVVLAFASALASVAFLPAYPIWSAAMIGLAVLAVWGATATRRENRT